MCECEFLSETERRKKARKRERAASSAPANRVIVKTRASDRVGVRQHPQAPRMVGGITFIQKCSWESRLLLFSLLIRFVYVLAEFAPAADAVPDERS